MSNHNIMANTSDSVLNPCDQPWLKQACTFMQSRQSFVSCTQKRDAEEDSGQNGLGVLCICTLVFSKVQIFPSNSKTTENRLYYSTES